MNPSPDTLPRCWTLSTGSVLTGRCSVPPPLRRRPIKINCCETVARPLLLSLAGCLLLFFLFFFFWFSFAAPVKSAWTLWTGSKLELCRQALEQQTPAHAFLISHRFEAGEARPCPIGATPDPRWSTTKTLTNSCSCRLDYRVQTLARAPNLGQSISI